MEVRNVEIKGKTLKEKIKFFYLDSQKILKKKNCATKDLFAPITDKWSLLCIYNLGFNEVMRFGELQKRVDGISARMLSVTLKKLEAKSIVHKKIYAEVPPRVEYRLTDYGRELTEKLVDLNHWLLKKKGPTQ